MRGTGSEAIVRRGLGALCVLALAACGGADTEADMDDADEVAEAPEAPAAAPASPDTTGAAVWAYLQEADYQNSWALWPDKGRLYPGQQPHGAQLTTYLNGIAMDALMGEAAEMPPGAIIVKENYMPDGTLAAVTTMMKVAGYNAEHADWFFSKHLASGDLDLTPEGMAMEGRVPGCQACHSGKADNDYLFTGELVGG